MASPVIVNIISTANTSGFTKASRAIAGFATKATALTGAAALAGAAVGQVGVAAGVMGAALAGAGALAVPALAAIKLGMDGIKQAAGAARAPAQRLKSVLSQEFAKGMAAGFKDLGVVLDSITPQMAGVARSVSGVFNGMAGTIRQNIPALQQLTAGASTFVTALGPGINKLTAGFIQFGANASKIAGQLGADFSNVLGKIGDALGKLDVAGLYKEYRASIGALFKGIGEFIRPVIALFGELAKTAGPIVGQVFSQLGATVTALTPALAQLGAAFGQLIVSALPALTPALVAVAEAMVTLVQAATPVIVIVAHLVSALAQGLGPALPVVVAGIVGLVVAFKSIAGAAAAVTGLNTILGVFGLTLTGVVAKARLFVAALARIAVAGVGAAISGIGTALTVVATGMRAAAMATWTFTAALLANPITWVVIAVVALVAAIYLIATKTTWFQTIWSAMCTAARVAWDFVVQAVQTGVQVLQAIWSAVVAFFTFQWQMIQAVASAVWSAITTTVQVSIAVIQAIVGAVVAFISAQWQIIQAVASAVWSGISAVVAGVAGAIQGFIAGAVGVIVGLWQRVQSVGAAAFGAVSAAVRAVGSAIQSVIGFVQSLISAIASIRFPSPPAWLSSLLSAPLAYPVPYGRVGHLAPSPISTLTLPPGALHLAQGYPSLRDLGALSGGKSVVVQHVDQSTHVNVDGSGIADPQAVAGAVAYATGRNSRTRGDQYAVQMGGSNRG